MQFGNLTIDPLAVAALVGFGSLLLIFAGLTVWLWRKAMAAPVAGESAEDSAQNPP